MPFVKYSVWCYLGEEDVSKSRASRRTFDSFDAAARYAGQLARSRCAEVRIDSCPGCMASFVAACMVIILILLNL